jgi:hypothetical protein
MASKNRSGFVVGAAGVLAACGMAFGQGFSTGFEAPTYTGSAAGTLLTNGFGGPPGQDGWYLPVACQDSNIYTYAGNAIGAITNTLGGAQFQGGIATTNFVRAEHLIPFTGGVWEVSYDFFAQWTAALPASDNIGSFSLQPSTTSAAFQTLQSWGTTVIGPVPNATDWSATADKFHIALGVDLVPSTGALQFFTASNDFRDLPIAHWYRVKVRWNFTTFTVLSASIQDLTAGTPVATVDVSANGWYLLGGPTSTNPLPTAARFFVGAGTGTSFGNLVAYDNFSITPVTVGTTCYANCDSSTNPPCLNVNDFVCFNNLFASGNSAANCDASSNPPILNVNDFVCFNNAFAARCGAGGANDCSPRP